MSTKDSPSKDETKKIEPLGNKAKPVGKKKPTKKMSGIPKLIHTFFSVVNNFLLAILLVILIVGGIALSYIANIINEIPPIDPTTIKDDLTENSIIVDSDGNLLETLYGNQGMRTKIDYNDIGQNMVNAIIAIEDKTFFEHAGFNYVRLIGSAVEAARTGTNPRGTSSITQQLAKNLYLTNEVALERKIKEAYYAVLLERALTKEQIIEAYLNKIALGMNNNGVQSASKMYFSKDAKDLDLVESAIIAGIPKAPSNYAPMNRIKKENVTRDNIIIDESDAVYTLVFNPNAQKRYNDVIYQMHSNEMISEAEYLFAKEADIASYLNPSVDKTNQISSYFGDMIKDDVADALALKEGISREEAENMLYNRGYIIEATIDFEMQKKLEGIYESIDFSPSFDRNTFEAVKVFQDHNNLGVDGVPGKNTLTSLVEQTTYNMEDFTLRSYSQGMYHEDIVKLKHALDELGLMSNDNLFPKATVMFNSDKNIVNDVTKKVVVFKYDNVINDEQQLVIKNEDYRFDENDNLVLLNNKSLSFYQQSDRVQVVVNKLFRYDETSEEPITIDKQRFTNISGLYIYDGKDVMIDDKYKTKVNNNLVIDKTFFDAYPDFFIQAENGDLLVDESNYYVNKRGVIQPQSAFVILDHYTGEIKAIIGGRESYGQNIFNRATSPQQPGSSVKPLGPYTVAIESRAWTAASVIDDIPSYLNDKNPSARWPYNWYENYEYKYRGRQNLRDGIEDSLNVLAVKLSQAVGVDKVVDQLKEFGITTVVESGALNDVNLSAVSLGGMTKGISPLELASAYSTFANKGVHIDPISFTRVTDLSGNTIIENIPKKNVVIDEQVAFILQDMMRGGVTSGGSSAAKIRTGNVGIPVAGKTGTTSDKRDVLFTGYTPYYTATVWFGNDIKLKMDNGSKIAAEFWSKVMTVMHEDLPDKEFVEPEGLQRVAVDRVSGKRPSELSALDPEGSQVYSEVFLPGTAPTDIDDGHVLTTVCSESGQLVTEYCPTPVEKVLRVRLEAYDPTLVLDKNGNPIYTADNMFTVPSVECELHQNQIIDINQVEKVLQTFPGGTVVFIRDYYLLLKNDSKKYIPAGSEVLIDYTIVLPNGELILADQYELSYITKPSTQAAELLKRLQESQPPEEPVNENNE